MPVTAVEPIMAFGSPSITNAATAAAPMLPSRPKNPRVIKAWAAFNQSVKLRAKQS